MISFTLVDQTAEVSVLDRAGIWHPSFYLHRKLLDPDLRDMKTRMQIVPF